ncbi:hypothetical protein BH18VER2_BH18VER2_04270 [soil metagenome]
MCFRFVWLLGGLLFFSGQLDAQTPPTFSQVSGTNNWPKRSDDNWRDTQESLIRLTGLAPADDAEAAIVRSFMPGNYTAVVRGKDGGSGVALVEVYNLQ